MASSDLALPPEYSLLEYRIESTLGVGGFGLTYLATDANLNLRVAIKEYLPGDLAQRDADHSVRPKSDGELDTFQWGLDRFLDESRTLASFRHPNIVRVMRFFQANRTAYMVMEFVAGQALSDWVKSRRPLNDASVRSILTPVLEGLGVVHAAGYLHRDIKPGNIFMREDGSPVLLDFGSARHTGGQELTAIVTPGYAPLEQYHTQGKQGPWSDLYALGGVLYWLVTGNKPMDAVARVREDPMTPAIRAGDASRFSPELLTAIDWMLVPPEDHRPQSVAEVLAALQGDAEITQRVAQTVKVAQPKPTAPSASSPLAASQTAASQPALDPETVKKIESELTRHIGPIGAVVMRTAAKKSASLQQLVEAVAPEIEDAAERTRFIKRFASDASTPVSRPTGPSTQNVATALAAARFDPAVLNKVEAALAQHLGPLARVVVKRAAMKARDEAELYLIVSDDIEDPAERKAFVRRGVAGRT